MKAVMDIYFWSFPFPGHSERLVETTAAEDFVKMQPIIHFCNFFSLRLPSSRDLFHDDGDYYD